MLKVAPCTGARMVISPNFFQLDGLLLPFCIIMGLRSSSSAINCEVKLNKSLQCGFFQFTDGCESHIIAVGIALLSICLRFSIFKEQLIVNSTKAGEF